MNTQQKKQSGFTIIEVVLVLAIAGLIFLMIFIALPALQRSQRDQARKIDLGRVQTAVTQFQTSNKNKLPGATTAEWNSFANNYLKVAGDSFSDPTRGDYQFNITTADPTYDETTAIITVALNRKCDGEGLVTSGSGNRKVALRIKLEGGGISCLNN